MNIIRKLALGASMAALLSSAAFADKLVVGFSQIGSESGWRAAETSVTKQQAETRGIDLKFADAQQKQENWNNMTPEQQQAQKQTMQSNMQTKTQGMNGQMGNNQMNNNHMNNNQMGNSQMNNNPMGYGQMGNNQMGNGQMGGNMNSGMKMQMQEKMQGMRSRMAR